MNLHVARLMGPVRRQLNWDQPRLTYIPDTAYRPFLSLRSWLSPR